MSKKVVFFLLIIIVISSFNVMADGLISGSLSLESSIREDSNEIPPVISRLNLALDKQGWENGFHVDVDLVSDLKNNDSVELKLNEVYYDYYDENFDIRVGKQRVVWGTANKFNPTDNLNPPDPENLFGDNLPLLMLKGNYYLDRYNLTTVFIPYHKPAKQNIIFKDKSLTAKKGTNSELAFKLSARGVNGFDYSLSLFRGYEDLPSIKMEQTTNGPAPIAYFREHTVYGADVATSVQGIGLWSEGAYVVPDHGNSYYSIVSGADYKFTNNVYLEGQLIYQQDQFGGEDFLLQGVIEDTFAKIHTARMGMVYNPETDGYLVTPELEFSLADATSLSVNYRFGEGTLGENKPLVNNNTLGINLDYFF